VLDVTYGYSLYVTDAPQRVFDLILPWQAWGGVWIGVGAICVAGAFMGTGRDRLAFMAAAALKACWGLLFIRVWLLDAVTRGWVSVVIWLAFAATVLLISAWPEPPRAPPVEEP
jgi:hypothetical protein